MIIDDDENSYMFMLVFRTAILYKMHECLYQAYVCFYERRGKREKRKGIIRLRRSKDRVGT